MNAYIDIQDICHVNTAVDRYDKQQQRFFFHYHCIYSKGSEQELKVFISLTSKDKNQSY